MAERWRAFFKYEVGVIAALERALGVVIIDPGVEDHRGVSMVPKKTSGTDLIDVRPRIRFVGRVRRFFLRSSLDTHLRI